jgi:hypothetical protein
MKHPCLPRSIGTDLCPRETVWGAPNVVQVAISPPAREEDLVPVRAGRVLPSLWPFRLCTQQNPARPAVERGPHIAFALKRVVGAGENENGVVVHDSCVSVSSRPLRVLHDSVPPLSVAAPDIIQIKSGFSVKTAKQQEFVVPNNSLMLASLCPGTFRDQLPRQRRFVDSNSGSYSVHLAVSEQNLCQCVLFDDTINQSERNGINRLRNTLLLFNRRHTWTSCVFSQFHIPCNSDLQNPIFKDQYTVFWFWFSFNVSNHNAAWTRSKLAKNS